MKLLHIIVLTAFLNYPMSVTENPLCYEYRCVKENCEWVNWCEEEKIPWCVKPEPRENRNCA